jgi:hypothetical protein
MVCSKSARPASPAVTSERSEQPAVKTATAINIKSLNVCRIILVVMFCAQRQCSPAIGRILSLSLRWTAFDPIVFFVVQRYKISPK